MPSAVSDCLFCKIVAGEADATVVSDGDRTLAIRDINPQAPTHLLILPKEHYPDAASMAAADETLLGEMFRAAAQTARAEGIDESGYRMVLNTGPDAQQSVAHVHLHVLGGRQFSWPPG